MDFLHRPPGAQLQDFINGYVNLESKEIETDSIHLYPNNCSYLTYSYLNTPTLLKANEEHNLPPLFVSGQVIKGNLRLKINERIGHLGIEFKPSGFYKLFQFDMSQLLNSFAPLSKVDSNYLNLLERLTGQKGFEERCDILENYLLARAETAVETDRVDHAIRLLEVDPGMKIKELCAVVAISERQLRRDFTKVVGVSPKVYAKIQQIKQVFLMINENKKEELKDYAYKCGYYDVAHFINAFQNDIGQNPSRFINGFNDYLSFYLGNNRMK